MMTSAGTPLSASGQKGPTISSVTLCSPGKGKRHIIKTPYFKMKLSENE